MSTYNKLLVNSLKKKNVIRTSQVEAAFRAVPRHIFLPTISKKEAYADRAIATKKSDGKVVSSSSQPSMMAIMLEQLELQSGHKVLEIGAGTGYNAALMAHIVGETGQVVSIDIDEDIVENAKKHLTHADVSQVRVICADGGYGEADTAPYDRIILTVGSSDIAPAWWEQLKPGGRIVLPLAILGAGQRSIAFDKVGNHLVSRSFNNCRFITLRGQFAPPSLNHISLGPRPGLFIEAADNQPIDSERVYTWLTGPSKDWPTGVETVVREFLYGRLRIWLELHAPDLCKLGAQGEMVAKNIIPSFIHFEGKEPMAITAVLFSETGMAALMWDPKLPPFLFKSNDFNSFDTRLPLFVRQFGSDESLALRLVTLLQEWAKAQQPSPNYLHIRAYPKATEYAPAENEFVIERPFHRYIIDFEG